MGTPTFDALEWILDFYHVRLIIGSLLWWLIDDWFLMDFYRRNYSQLSFYGNMILKGYWKLKEIKCGLNCIREEKAFEVAEWFFDIFG